MIKSHSVEIKTRTKATGSEGEVTFTYATAKTILADVQPARLSEVEAAMWGVTDLAAVAKKMFTDRDTSIVMFNQALVESETYEVKGINHWPTHSEFLLIPVQGV